MHYFVTGCSGFIGSNLVDRLLENGHYVTGYDNFSTGLEQFLIMANKSPRFTLVRGDLLDLGLLTSSMINAEVVLHMAANADVRFGTMHPYKDLEQNTLATYNVLEAMRANDIRRIAFASTGSIYGESAIIPTPENAPFPIQTSLYGSSKLAAEGLIQAYCEGFGFQANIFRFVSILGERYTHGHVIDFYKQLLINPNKLTVLGDGRQKKSYLYIHDCIDAMLYVMGHIDDKINIFNLGTDEYCQVNNSIHWICHYLNIEPIVEYTGGERGWIGDNPFIFLDCSKIRALGWKPKLSIQEGIVKTIEFLSNNHAILDCRP